MQDLCHQVAPMLAARATSKAASFAAAGQIRLPPCGALASFIRQTYDLYKKNILA